MKHKLFTLLLAIMASVGTMFAESGTCGENLTWSLTDSILTIDGQGEMWYYETYGNQTHGSIPWDKQGFNTLIISENVTSFDNYAFVESTKLRTIYWNARKYGFYSGGYYWTSTNDNTKFPFLETIIFGETVDSIPDFLCYSCENLKNVYIHDGVKYIGNSAFSGCAITSIEIPNSVSSIWYYAFSSCSGLTSLTCKATTPPTLESNVFSYVDKSIPLYVPAQSVDLYKAADQWKDFTNILPIGETPAPCITASGTCGAQGDNLSWELSCDGVLTISGTGAMEDFCALPLPPSGAPERKKFILPFSNSPWNDYALQIVEVHILDGVTNIDKCAFEGSYNLISITIGSNVESIESAAFSGCSSLTSIFVKESNPKYDSRDNCNAIIETATNTLIVGCQNSTIPNSVTSIGESAFQGCSGLTSVTIPNSVTSIGIQAFYNCSGLTSITCEAVTPPTLGDGVFYKVDKSIPLYVPAQSVDLYKAAYQWKDFTNILPIPGTEPETFTITWQDEEGNPIKVDEIAYGEIPVFSGATPTKEATAEYTYEFAGWLPKVKEATKDICYTTYFKEIKIEPTVYNVNINGENCSLHISNELPAGTTLQVEAVADECFEFEKWSDNNTDNPRTITVTEDSNLTAEFNKVTYTITGENENEGGEVQIIP